MRKKLLLLATMAFAALPFAAQAQTTDDPLHFTCTGCGGDNGHFTPDPTGSFSGVMITSSPPGAVGDLTLKLLIPDTFHIDITFADAVTRNGVSVGSLTLAKGLTQFIAGETLEGFLGVTNFAPGAAANPFGAFDINVDTGLAGFYVATLDVGQVDLSNSGSFSLSGLLSGCDGCWLMGDLATAKGDITTAPSAALLSVAAVPGPMVGAGLPGIISGALGLWAFAKRRRRNKLA